MKRQQVLNPSFKIKTLGEVIAKKENLEQQKIQLTMVADRIKELMNEYNKRVEKCNKFKDVKFSKKFANMTRPSAKKIFRTLLRRKLENWITKQQKLRLTPSKDILQAQWNSCNYTLILGRRLTTLISSRASFHIFNINNSNVLLATVS